MADFIEIDPDLEGDMPSSPTLAATAAPAIAAPATAAREIPPLPPSEFYETFDDLYAFLQRWAIANGMAFVKKSASNYRDLGDGNGKVLTYRPLLYDRGPSRPPRGTGQRNTATQKLDYQYKVIVTATARNN